MCARKWIDDDEPVYGSLAPEIDTKLKRIKPPGEQVRFQVATDFINDRSFGEKWLIATDRQLLFIPTEGVNGIVEVPLTAVREARTEELVGGGCLAVELKEGEPIYLHYSNTLVPKFAEIAEGIQQLSKGEPLELPTEIERTRCEKCRRLLAEKDGRCINCTKKRDTLWRILSYVRPYYFQLILVFVITSVAALIDLLPPLITEHIIDDVLTPKANFGLLVWFVVALLGIRLLMWFAQVGRTAISSWLGFRAAEDIRAELYHVLQFTPLRFYDKRKVGSLISRMTNDADLLEEYMTFDLPFILSNALLLLGILGMLLHKSWLLTIYVLLPVPPIILGGALIWNRMERYWRRWSIKWGRFSAHLNESITGIRLVKAFAQEKREGIRFNQRNDELRQVSVSADRAWFVFFTVTNFLMSFGVFFVWYFGGRQILGGELTLGQLTAFISYLWMFYRPLKWFGDYYNFMIHAYAGAERIFEVMDTPMEPFNDPRAKPMPQIEGRVCFRDVTFGYDPGKPVLKEIDFEVAPGEMIGLVGKSESAKARSSILSADSTMLIEVVWRLTVRIFGTFALKIYVPR